jgi:hypothetical protein
MSENKAFAAFVSAQKQFGPALKTHTNPAFRSKYADLSACVEAVVDALNANGLGLMQKTIAVDSGVCVETVFLHESGASISSGPFHVPASKQDPQGYGSALTYARRYSLMAACGIAPEDDDGNAASKPRKTAEATPPARAEVKEPPTAPLTESQVLDWISSIHGASPDELPAIETGAYAAATAAKDRAAYKQFRAALEKRKEGAAT